MWGHCERALGAPSLKRREGVAGSLGQRLEASVTGKGRGRASTKTYESHMSDLLEIYRRAAGQYRAPCAPTRLPCDCPVWPGPPCHTEKPTRPQRTCKLELAFRPMQISPHFPNLPSAPTPGSQGPALDSPHRPPSWGLLTLSSVPMTLTALGSSRQAFRAVGPGWDLSDGQSGGGPGETPVVRGIHSPPMAHRSWWVPGSSVRWCLSGFDWGLFYSSKQGVFYV